MALKGVSSRLNRFVVLRSGVHVVGLGMQLIERLGMSQIFASCSRSRASMSLVHCCGSQSFPDDTDATADI
jgi:hypothetical protein